MITVTIHFEERLGNDAMLFPRKTVLNKLIRAGMPIKINKIRIFSDIREDEFEVQHGTLKSYSNEKDGSVTYEWEDEEGHDSGQG